MAIGTRGRLTSVNERFRPQTSVGVESTKAYKVKGSTEQYSGVQNAWRRQNVGSVSREHASYSGCQ